MAEPIPVGGSDRRRLERRTNPTLAELTLPELRRMMVTSIMFVIVLVLFLWMVRTVIIASILGVIVAVYTRPVYLRVLPRLRLPVLAASFTLALLIVPMLALSVYSYREIAERAAYVELHQDEITTRIDSALRRLPFVGSEVTSEAVKHYVVVASNYGTNFLSGLRNALASLAVAATIFLFTAYYVMVEAESIMAYIKSRIPPRYGELSTALESNQVGEV